MSENPSTLWVFANVARQMFLQGLWRGSLYGSIYGTLYGMCLGGAIIGLPDGFAIGLLTGVMLGLVAAVLLGVFSAQWSRSLGLQRMQSQSRPEWIVMQQLDFRRAFTLIAVTTTVGGSQVAFPVAEALVFGHSVSGWFDPLLVLVPSVIAGLAAYQASRRVVSWCEENVDWQPTKTPVVIQEGVWPPPPIR